MFWQEEDLLSTHWMETQTESLQTDIQRFMAILGFCLMAVFALVQSIPVVGQERSNAIEAFSHKVNKQVQELIHLRNDNRRLKEEVNRLLHREEILGSLKKKLHKAARFIDRQREEINRLLEEKIRPKDDWIGFRKELLIRDKEIKKLAAAKQRLETILKEVIQKVKVRGRRKIRPDQGSRKPAGEKGLYVAFESDPVFMKLLSSGKIQLFIKVMGVDKAFRVFKDDGALNFEVVGSVNGLDLWEIKESMVPPQILKAFRSWTTLSSREKIFVVGLPPEISRQIRERKDQGGRLIIGKSGKVSYSLNGE